MLKKAARAVWKILPPFVRLKVIRITQQKFTFSAAAIITNDKDEVLLLNHVLRPYGGWGLPGGFVNAGEQPEAAIRREIREETELELTELKMLSVRVARSHVEMLFSAKASGMATVNSREIMELGWFTADTTPDNLSNSQLAVIRSVLDLQI